MFIPTTPEEVAKLGWNNLDVILVSGDTYIDSPYSGVALIGHQLIRAGYKTGIIAQPDVSNPNDITRLGVPRLFWGITAGMVDSMVANTTALGKPRRMDDNTPGGVNNRRPNRATIVYTQPDTPLVQKSRSHCSWELKPLCVAQPIMTFGPMLCVAQSCLTPKLFLLYGMADNSILELAETLKMRGDPRGIRGLCYLSPTVPKDYIEMPSFEACELNKQKFVELFKIFYENNDPITAKGLAQKSGNRYVIQNPPALPLTTEEMDYVYSAPFENNVHPYYKAMGVLWGHPTPSSPIGAVTAMQRARSFHTKASHQLAFRIDFE